MIYLYDKIGNITHEYDDWKLRDVEIDIHNGSLSGEILQCDDRMHFKFQSGQYVEKNPDEKLADKLITKKERDELIAAENKQAEDAIIQQEMYDMARERAVAAGKIQ